jgi:hypothetical protein
MGVAEGCEWRATSSSLPTVGSDESGVPANDPAMTTDDKGGELRRTLDENQQLRAEIDRLRADNERMRDRLNDLEAAPAPA